VPSITATKTRVTTGGSTTITWSATGVAAGQTCTVTGKDIGGVGINSITTTAADAECKIITGPPKTITVTGQTIYTMTCGTAIATKVINTTPGYKEF
jgi:hypothetical protein